MKESEVSFNIDANKLIEALQGSKIMDSGRIQLNFSGVEELKTYFEKEQKKILTPDDYYRFEEIVKKNGINLKDIREIIMLAYSWWRLRRADPYVTDEIIFSHIFYGYEQYREEIRDKIYSEDFINSTLNALSTCNNPVTDFFSRVNSVDPRDYKVFEEYFKKVYGTTE